MNALQRMNPLLRRFGIDPVHYWLLLDLFEKLSDRRELFSQLGRDGATLKKAAWAYYILSGLMVALFLVGGMSLGTYFQVFLSMTAFLLLAILLSETSNSLLNPVEGLVLAHQPIDGATYTAAKLTHLLRILAHLVPGLNLIPALAALTIHGCPWYYPLAHMSAAFAVGVVLALFCCALFGWLIRFLPPARLKSVGFAAEMAPWLVYMTMQFSGGWWRSVHIDRWLPRELAWVAAALGIAAVVLGVRALSGDYLVRVAAIAHGGSARPSRVRRSRLGALVSRWLGGPPARAGFEYLSRMMRRDWQFRRQMVPLIPLTVVLIAGAARSLRNSPFSVKFTGMHLLPHVFGFAFFTMCNVIVFGSDHQGTWLFQLAPGGALRPFARGVWARLFAVAFVPHLLLLPVLAWYWGFGAAGLFLAYSAAAVAVYLGLELRLIEGLPFGKQPEVAQNPYLMPLMLLGSAVVAIAVGAQYFLLFRSVLAVIAATLGLAVTAWFLTVNAIETLETAIRFHLGMLSTESKGLYQEVVA